MSSSMLPQILGLAGAPASGANIQNVLRAQLIGVDLAAFSPGDPSAEAVVRRDPGAAQATLTFTKSGQTLSLPTELAKALVGQAYGAASIAVEILGSSPDGSISASLSRIGAAAMGSPEPSVAEASASAAKFSPAAMALAQASSIALGSPSQWSNLISVLLPAMTPEQASALSAWTAATKTPPASAQTQAPGSDPGQQARGAIAKSLADIVPGAGVGFERTVASMSTRGVDEQARMETQIGRFAQAAAPGAAESAQWIAQQASAASLSEVLWHGQAWGGAPAWLALGSSESPTENAQEVYSKLGRQAKDTLAWIRMRVEPASMGPIDLWAALLGAGRCHARLRAPESAKPAMAAAKQAFASALEGARVDLRVDYGPIAGEEPQ